MAKNIIFIIPDEKKVYEEANVRVGSYHTPSLTFAILGAIAKNNNFNPEIIDLTFYKFPEEIISDRLRSLDPEFVGITCTSASYHQAVQIARIVKQESPFVKVVVGGPHVSVLPEEALRENVFDYVFIGEGEVSFDRFLKGVDPGEIEGIAFKESDGTIYKRCQKEFLTNWNFSPLPDYTLYRLSEYHVSRLHAKGNPVVWIETSRGCPFDCSICNKVVHGRTFRPKTVGRVLSEIKLFLKNGIKDFFIADDGFTTDMERAEEICNMIIRDKLEISWSCMNGVRVDRVNRTLLNKMKEAGCYRISFGIESGNQNVLDNLGKGVTLEQIESAVKMCKEAGLEIFGLFMFGFLDETLKTMQDTIDFAKRLPLDLVKASIIIPFPGSPLYEKYKALGLLYPVGDYRNFNFYTAPHSVYKHPTLEWADIIRRQEKFHRSFYLNPKYILRRLRYSIRSGSVITDLKAAFKMQWFRQKGWS